MSAPATRFVHHVGLEIVEHRDGAARGRLAVQPHHFNTGGALHGGVAFTLADTTMGAAIIPGLAKGERCATIEIKMSYFKAVFGGVLECEAQVVNRGKSVASVEASVFADGVLVARATSSFAIFTPKEASA